MHKQKDNQVLFCIKMIQVIYCPMSNQKKHGMNGKRNASKGRENWVRTTITVDPKLKAKALKAGLKLNDLLDQKLRDTFNS